MNKCLVIVDLQNDYFPGGKMSLFGIDSAVENARALLTEFRKTKTPIIHVQHISLAPDAFFFLPGTDGAEINVRVSPQEGETNDTIIKASEVHAAFMAALSFPYAKMASTKNILKEMA